LENTIFPRKTHRIWLEKSWERYGVHKFLAHTYIQTSVQQRDRQSEDNCIKSLCCDHFTDKKRFANFRRKHKNRLFTSFSFSFQYSLVQSIFWSEISKIIFYRLFLATRITLIKFLGKVLWSDCDKMKIGLWVWKQLKILSEWIGSVCKNGDSFLEDCFHNQPNVCWSKVRSSKQNLAPISYF
jgi:hypothetical protein